MKSTFISGITILIGFLLTGPVYAQCENTDFEYGNFTNWTGYTGYTWDGITTPGIVPERHTIITSNAMDPNTNNQVSMMPPLGGGAYSVRLGNANVGAEAERLLRPFTVTADNRLFIYQYALILEDPDGHAPSEKPRFEVKVYDENGDIIDPEACGYYQVTAGPETDSWGQYGTVRYKNWSTVGIDLAAYIGTTVTIEFTVLDCALGGHYGYAYLDASCGFLDVQVFGFCEGSPTVTLVAPDGFDTYYWPHSGQTTQTVVIPAPEIGDSITVQVTNQSGCETTILHIFEEYPLVEAVVGNDTAICAGQEVDLWCNDAGPGAHYSWTANGLPVSNEQQFTVAPLANTTYEVIVSNPNGCYSPDSAASLTITVDTDLIFQLPGDFTICNGDPVTLGAPLPGNSYTWYTATGDTLGTSDSITFAPPSTQTYYLEISNGDCSYTDSMVVSVFNAATLPDVLPTSFCEGITSFVLTAPNDFSSYLWDNGTTGQYNTINPYTDTVAEVHLISPGGCLDSMTFILEETPYPVPVAVAQEDTICVEQSVLLSATSTPPGSTFHWTSASGGFSNTGSSIYVTPQQTTTYYVQAISQAGCTDESSYDTLTIVVDTSARFAFGEPVNLCSGEQYTLAAPVAAQGYEWIHGMTGAILSTDSVLVISPDFSGAYYLTADQGTCHYTAYQLVYVNQVVESNQPVQACGNGSPLLLTAPAAYTDVYWPLFGNNALQNTLSQPVAGQVVALYADNLSGCTDTIRYLVSLITPTVLQPLADDSVCYGSAFLLNAQSSYPSDTYTWISDPAGTTGSGATLTTFPLETTSYTVTVSNATGCVGEPSSQTALITVLTGHLIEPIAPVLVCPGTEVTLSSPGTTGDFSWNYGDQQSMEEEFIFTANQPGYVSVTVSDGPCSNSISVPVTLFGMDGYSLFVSANMICTGDDATLSVLPGTYTNIDWYENSGFLVSNTTGISVSPGVGTTYYGAQVTDPNGCVVELTQSLQVDELPVVNLGPDRTVCGDSVTDIGVPATAGYTYLWSTSETQSFIGINASGNYTLEVYNGACMATDMISVQFLLQSYLGTVPNVITPNDDQLNDLFEISSKNLAEYEIVILNRWGNKLFSSNDPTQYWDGKTDGESVEEGVYFYLITYRTACEDEATRLQGHVTVTR